MALVRLYDRSRADEPPQHRLRSLGLVRECRHGDRRLKQPGERRLARLECPAPEPTHGCSLSVLRLPVHDEQGDVERRGEVYGGELSGTRLDERKVAALKRLLEPPVVAPFDRHERMFAWPAEGSARLLSSRRARRASCQLLAGIGMVLDPCGERGQFVLRDREELQVLALGLPLPAEALRDRIGIDCTVHGVSQLRNVSQALIDPLRSICARLCRRVSAARLGSVKARRYAESQSPRQTLAYRAPAFVHPAEVEREPTDSSSAAAEALLHTAATVPPPKVARKARCEPDDQMLRGAQRLARRPPRRCSLLLTGLPPRAPSPLRISEWRARAKALRNPRRSMRWPA